MIILLATDFSKPALTAYRYAAGLALHGRRGWKHLAMGSVAEHVVRHSAVPVLTVKSPKYVSHLAKTGKEKVHATKQN